MRQLGQWVSSFRLRKHNILDLSHSRCWRFYGAANVPCHCSGVVPLHEHNAYNIFLDAAGWRRWCDRSNYIINGNCLLYDCIGAKISPPHLFWKSNFALRFRNAHQVTQRWMSITADAVVWRLLPLLRDEWECLSQLATFFRPRSQF